MTCFIDSFFALALLHGKVTKAIGGGAGCKIQACTCKFSADMTKIRDKN